MNSINKTVVRVNTERLENTDNRRWDTILFGTLFLIIFLAVAFA